MKKADLEKINRKNFKALMNTLSMPGTVEKIAPLYGSALLAVANILLYNEVSFFYEGSEDISIIKAINNPKRESKQNADYLFGDFIDKGFIEISKNGDFLNPDFSSTHIFKCKDFNNTKAVLNGPGIDGEKKITLPCDEEFITALKNKNSSYPLGVEVYFINEKSEILALNRTTKIEVS